jgi:hypothetical protein
MPMPDADRTRLRELARRVADAADLPVMTERRRMWREHNALRRVRPMVLLFPEGSWRELLPDDALECESDGARRAERDLRRRLYEHEHFHQDKPVEKNWDVRLAIRDTGWGLEPEWTWSDDPTGARAFKPVIHSPDDLAKLRKPQLSLDPAETDRRMNEAVDLFGDLLDVRLRGVNRVSFHFMARYTALRGLEQVMTDMVAAPDFLHQAMQFYHDAYQGMIDQWRAMNVLCLNNDGTYQSSGGVGYTDELPADGFDPGRVRTVDLWASAEEQELALVSPAMHEEFCIQYERPLLAQFGLNGYGCCEDLTAKIEAVLSIPNMRRISIAPFASVERCAETLGDRAIFSWKPHPAHLAGEFDPAMIRAYIRHALDVTKDCVIEIILKDTHTCDHRPERFDEWSRIAMELAEAC